MVDSDDELEPLFDYSRIQPIRPKNLINIDDDSDSSPPIALKRRKLSKPADDVRKKKVDEPVNVIDCEAIDDSLDWLSPPLIKFNDLPKPEEDSIIKALREKRAQLASVSQSAKEILEAVDESARKTICSFETSDEPDVRQLSKPQERVKIVIRFQDKDGDKSFRVFADDKFERLFKMYAEKAKLDPKFLVFSFDGEKISPKATPDSLGMEDEDIIEVLTKSR